MTLRKHLDTAPARKARRKHPAGWEPGYEDTGSTVTLTAAMPQPPQADTWRELLRAEGYDPDEYHVAETHGVQHRKWQQREGGDYLRYFKFTAVRNDATRWNADDLIARVQKRRALKPKPSTGTHALVVCLSDWQMGADHGGGPGPLIERINQLGPAVVARWRELRKLGIPLDTLYVHSGGDMGEGCGDHYAQQTYTVHLNHEEQREAVRAGLDMLIDQWAPVVPRIAVYAVPGNHGEYRKAGKSYTDLRDNVDVGVWVDLALAYSKNPGRYGHVQIHTPPDQELELTYSHEGFITTVIHGHQARSGGDVMKKMETWWKGQMAGQRPAGDADLLSTSHYHHFRISQQGPRTHMMCPALCGSQDWWVNMSGLDSPPGTLTYTLSKDGWDNLQIIEPKEQ